MSSSRLFKQLFQTGGTSVGSGSTSVGNWVCPAGVKWVIITGCGGGGGGGGGASVSSTNSASPLFIWYIAMGGGGGQASITATQVVAVTPGVSYPVSIGQGGAGANNTGFGVYNGAPTGVNQFGGVCFGNAGSQGASSIFGSVVLPGGLGGRRGEIMAPPWAANEITNFVPSDNVTGLNPYGFGAIPGTYNGIPNPPGLLSSPYSADAVALQGAINNATSLVANAALPGLSRIFRANGLGGGGGGGGGGYSNNIYSVGGQGGQGAQGVNGYPFSTGGNSGVYGGGGGGGGGGEGLDYNNTHDGSGGGNGGSGFIEIAWVQ